MKIKKKSLHMIGILLCICAVVFCGVFYYLSNYNLKIWYTLQNEETQQEVRTLMRQYIKLSDEYWDYELERGDILLEREELSDDLVNAKLQYEKFQEDYGVDCYGALKSDYNELKWQYEDLQRQYDDLDEKYRGRGLLMEHTMTRREEIGDKIREFGFRGEPRTFEMEEIMNNN